MFLSSNWRNIGKCEHFPSDEDPRRRELLTNAYLSFYFPMVLVGWSNCVLFSLVVSPQLHGVFPGPLPGTLVVSRDGKHKICLGNPQRLTWRRQSCRGGRSLGPGGRLGWGRITVSILRARPTQCRYHTLGQTRLFSSPWTQSAPATTET